MSYLHVQPAKGEVWLLVDSRSPGFSSVTLLRAFVTFNQGFLPCKIEDGNVRLKKVGED